MLSADSVAWERGVVYAEGQNLARLLMEAPANHITPTAFANTIEEKLAPHAEHVTINKRFVHHHHHESSSVKLDVAQKKTLTVQSCFLIYLLSLSVKADM